MDTDSRMMVVGLRGGEIGSQCLTGAEFQFYKMKKDMGWVMGRLHSRGLYLVPLNGAL